MKPLYLLYLVLAALFACRPHYDFARVRAEISQEAKRDSLLYRSAFSAGDTLWPRNDVSGKTSLPEAGALFLRVEAAGKTVMQLSPCGMLHEPYSLSVTLKIQVSDSTDCGYAGICFDRIDTAYYRALYISNKGTFCLKSISNSEEELLIPEIPSRYLNKGHRAVNTIEIRHRRKELRILFNGSIAAICKLNGAFSHGETGLIAATAEKKTRFSPVKAFFESFELKKIKGS